MQSLTKEDVLNQAKEYNVKFIRLQFSDILGVLRNTAITVEELPKALEGFVTCDSSVVDTAVHDYKREVRLLPDPASFVVFPWRPREGAVARLICDVTNEDGTPYHCCSRTILRQAIGETEALGLRVMLETKNKFYLFKTDENSRPTTVSHDQAGYFALFPSDLGENVRRDMVLTLEEMGLEVLASHHEVGPGQHEICLKYDNALAMADKLTTFRFVVRTIASRHNLHASFMPQPMNNLPSSGLRIFQTVYRGLNNIFMGENQQPSGEALSYVAGLLEHYPAFLPVTNPLINSYKRLYTGAHKPTLAGWSYHRRDTIVRLPLNKGERTGIEIRNPDSACNPYLAFALLIKAGLAGLTKKLTPPPPLEEISPRIPRLPANLGEALSLLKTDSFFGQSVGEGLAAQYLTTKEQEWTRFNQQVHPWEVEEYLQNF
ncbi:MAG TPA: glutamine synthetase family protein [Bacillota bacterium]|nr:glutamine synthetase family protein [Bacillota bacterium]